MTDLSGTIPPTVGAAHEDRTLPAVVYGLYFLGLAYGVTALIGLIVAYANLGSAGPKMRSHYVFQVRTVWTGLAWALIGGALIVIGGILSIILIGVPIIKLGFLVLSLICLWALARCIAGAIYLSQDQAYPRPRSWLL
ncbi:MAG TPA: hypothetical protein VGI79_05130 [Caulobacteraceae bacterium]|jgi:uncharacterized membrane protein